MKLDVQGRSHEQNNGGAITVDDAGEGSSRSPLIWCSESRIPIRFAFFVMLGFCLSRSAPGVGWFDAGEWALVIQDLGVGHPPGSPGYMLLAWVFAKITGGDLASRLVAFSALCTAFMVFPLDELLRRFLKGSAALRALWSITILAMPQVMLQAVRIELYALATLMSLYLVVLCMSVWTPRRWWCVSLLFGALISVNPAFAVVLSPMLGLYLTRVLPRIRKSRIIGLSAVTFAMIFTVGLPYVYLIFVASKSTGFVWGDWDVLSSFWFYFTGQDYRVNWQGDVDRINNLKTYCLHWWESGILVVIFGGSLAVWLYNGTRRWVWRLGFLGACILLYFALSNRIFFPEIPDYHGYASLWYLLSGVSFVALISKTTIGSKPFVQLTFVFVLGFTFATNGADLSDQRLPTVLSQDLLSTLPKDATLVLASDHLLFPLMYQQRQGVRPDVLLINQGFMGSGWYLRFLKRTHNALNVDNLIAPMPRTTRVKRLLRQRSPSSVYFESASLAVRLGFPVCDANPLPRLGVDCRWDTAGDVMRMLDGYWQISPTHLPYAPRVIAGIAEAAAVPYLQRGHFAEGLDILRAGIAPTERPSPCPEVGGTKISSQPQLPSVLIGHSTRNLIHYSWLCRQLR